MTVSQLKIAIAVKDLGSISSAAEELHISQPNASSSIKLLEKEIGFVIFKRSKSGIVITEKGNFFLRHAELLLKEHNTIMNIKKYDSIYRLRVGAVNYLSAAEPFLKLCEQHRNDEKCEFSFFNVSVDEGIEQLDSYDLDIVFAPAMNAQLTGIKKICKEKNIEMISLGEIPAVISVRKGHPAIEQGLCANITQGSDAMKEYPYVAYRNLSEDSGATGYNDTHFIQSRYIMYVDEVTVRLRLVASTDAFMFGITPSRGVKERHGLVSFPVPGISLEVFCLVLKSESTKTEIQDYINLMKEELELIRAEN